MRVAENRLLLVAICASLLLHAAFLAVRFSPPDSGRMKPMASQLEIILVNARHDKSPLNPDALAQHNLNGGGNADAGRAKSPLPDSPQSADGEQIDIQRRRIAALEQQQKRLLTQMSSLAREPLPLADQTPHNSATHGSQTAPVDYPALARREAEIARTVEDYSKRPVRTQLTPSTRVVSYAMYYTALQKKIEQTGTRHFPQQDGKKIYGDLIVYIPVYQDGSIYEKEGGPRIERSSGNSVLDRAALAIVRRAAPFDRFPQAAIEDGKTHLWEIVTRFRFTHNETLETSASRSSP